jgi:hypothetical protein
MDILNWLYVKTQGLVRTEANNAKTDLIALGANVGFQKRDDQYLTYAMPLADAVASADAANTGYYTLDLGVTSVLDVTTPKGVIEIVMDTSLVSPLPLCETAVGFTLTNSNMDFSNPDNIYMQHSAYYNPTLGDNFVPHVISTGVLAGANYAIFNTNLLRQTSIRSYIYTGGGTVLAGASTTYSFLSGTTSGSGQDARWAITRDNVGNISEVYLIDAGETYAPADTILITGDLIGGTNGVDNLTITVNSIHGANQFGGRLYLYYELYNF